MTEFTVQLTDEQYAELSQRAQETGTEPARQLQREIGALFESKRDRLPSIIREVVRDNRILYERLA